MDAEFPAAKKVPRNVKAKPATVKASRGAAMTTAATPEHAKDTRAASVQSGGGSHKAAALTGEPAKTQVGGTSKPAPRRRAAKASRGAANVAAAKPAGSEGAAPDPTGTPAVGLIGSAIESAGALAQLVAQA